MRLAVNLDLSLAISKVEFVLREKIGKLLIIPLVFPLNFEAREDKNLEFRMLC